MALIGLSCLAPLINSSQGLLKRMPMLNVDDPTLSQVAKLIKTQLNKAWASFCISQEAEAKDDINVSQVPGQESTVVI
ncbi:hypothetical protein K435DRAFT_877718 [Dendrothele bispora CBS 962.96]|uniref:Uncharacterized protein n=1 Tax=Dendrothele bispora (strain CBS 962.96) TaxID=1314807 RepID=A0A4S8KPB8_DENBC|nr:hypothetical protein K435DRAFT_877718 [Dendrothele bispora CBS 962.96]